MIRCLICNLLLVTLFVLAEVPAGNACFRGRPLPECSTFWITEAGVQFRLDDHGNPHWKNRKWHEKLLYSWELGIMKNKTRQHALGGSIILSYDDYQNNIRYGIMARYRRWMTFSTSLDLGLGLIASSYYKTGYTGAVALNSKDYVALTGRFDIIKIRHRSGYDLAWYGGIKFCSYSGLIVGVACPIIVAVLFSDLSSGGDWNW